jgi:HK97 family phage portal protein
MIAEALFLEHRTRKTTSLTEPSSWFRNFIFGGLTESNVEINTETALTLSAVFNAVTLISDAHKVAPLQVYHRINDGKELADDHGVYKLLHRKPNREMTPGMFKWFISASKLLWGNGFAEIERDGAGRPMALWPIHPSVVEMLRDGSKTYYYKVYPSDNNVPVAIPRENMLHVPGFAANGMWGVSVIKYAAESLGVGLAAQKYGARFFGNDARPSVIIKHPEHFKT